MQVSLQRVDPSLPLPQYESRGAVGFDLITRETTVIESGKIALVPGNVIVKVPQGYALMIVPRSSLPRKKGLVCPHSIGIIDQDYHGEKDEILVQVQNILAVIPLSNYILRFLEYGIFYMVISIAALKMILIMN